ncbi:MAG: hypothetical protein KIS79_06280 [Burkholderiales bacterium]|nr:hypothetical protein [Burkholderiales bacterium]
MRIARYINSYRARFACLPDPDLAAIAGIGANDDESMAWPLIEEARRQVQLLWTPGQAWGPCAALPGVPEWRAEWWIPRRGVLELVRVEDMVLADFVYVQRAVQSMLAFHAGEAAVAKAMSAAEGRPVIVFNDPAGGRSMVLSGGGDPAGVAKVE